MTEQDLEKAIKQLAKEIATLEKKIIVRKILDLQELLRSTENSS